MGRLQGGFRKGSPGRGWKEEVGMKWAPGKRWQEGGLLKGVLQEGGLLEGGYIIE